VRSVFSSLNLALLANVSRPVIDLIRIPVLSALLVAATAGPRIAFAQQSVSKESVGTPANAGKLVTKEPNSLNSPTAEVDQRWATPLQANERFFTAPEFKVAPSSRPTPEANRPRRAVKLLGIGSVGDQSTAEVQAVLKVDDQVTYKKVGDMIDDIEVIDIGFRSITLQSQGERWTIDFAQQAPTTKVDSPNRSTAANPPRRPKVVMPTVAARASDAKPPVLPEPAITTPIPDAAAANNAPKLPVLDLPPLPDLPNFESSVISK
jgi:hypothetical protein